MIDFILASNSPRRKEILSKAGFTFRVIPSNYDEKICGLKYSAELVENCAYNKALDVSKKAFGTIVAADTVVVLDNFILGKPIDEDEAFFMLKNLSNKTHFVATSFCILNDEKVIKNTDITYVTFRELSDKEIKEYIKTKKPLDKAGSYGIQDEGFNFAIKTDGSINNVIGFPLELFKHCYYNITNKQL